MVQTSTQVSIDPAAPARSKISATEPKGPLRVKFYQLRPGARFRYRGGIYRKVAPLKAASEADDSQRLIPRSVEVTLLDAQGEAVADALPDMLPGRRVEAAIERFLPACERAATLIDPPLSESQRTQLQRAFTTAGQDLLMDLAQDD
jgi:hypothetical protein